MIPKYFFSRDSVLPPRQARRGAARRLPARHRGFEVLEDRRPMAVLSTLPRADVERVISSPQVLASRITPVIGVVARGGVFNGSPFPARVALLGLSGQVTSALEGVAPIITYCSAQGICSQSPPFAAGTYTATASFPGSDTYAAVQSKPTSFTIAKAKPTIQVTHSGGTFAGRPLPAIVTLAGKRTSLDGVSPTIIYCTPQGECSPTPPTAAGAYTVTASFPGSANYLATAGKTVAFSIAKATPSLQVATVGGRFTGSPFPAAVTLVGVAGTASSLQGVAPVVTYCTSRGSCSQTPPTAAGTYTVSATFAGTADYTAARSKTVSFTIADPGVDNVVKVTQASFQSLIATAKGPVIVDFTADWCSWCRIQSPILKQVAQKRPDIIVAEIDLDTEPRLGSQFGVTSIPRLLVFKGGRKTADVVGLRQEQAVLALLDS